VTLNEAAASKYWYTPEGIQRRIDALSRSFTYKIVNNSLMAYGESAGITEFQWMTDPGATKTGPCPYCASKNGNIYRKGQFLPPLPAHSNCVCQWALLYSPSRPIPYVI